MVDIDFQSLLEQIEVFQPLKQMEQDTGISYAHLINIKKGRRRNLSFNVGFQIITYHSQVMASKFEYLKERIANGWQV